MTLLTSPLMRKLLMCETYDVAACTSREVADHIAVEIGGRVHSPTLPQTAPNVPSLARANRVH